jgi:hypothetical protein
MLKELPQSQALIAEGCSRRMNKEIKSRIFTYFPNTIHYLRKQDNVLIYVPEDLLILGAVDPSLHKQIVTFLKFRTSDCSEAEIRLKNGDICCVPSFCLLLEKQVLQNRMHETTKIQEYKSNARTMDVEHFELMNRWS